MRRVPTCRSNPLLQHALRHVSSLASNRRGAMLVLVAVVIIALLAMTMFTVDVAYMQLVRTELRAATDASAKAGMEALRRTQDADAAVAAAIATAAANKVGGESLLLTVDQVELGAALRNADNSVSFSAGQLPYTAVRVNSAMTNDSAAGPVPLFFGGVFGINTFQPTRSAVSASTEVEICFAIDRSHSMCFDLTGVDWSYPPGTPRTPDPIAYPPHASLSRWASLAKAMQSFVNITATQEPKPRVAMVTWASKITQANYEGKLTKTNSPEIFVDVPLTTDLSSLNAAISARSSKVMLGATNMSAGIDEARKILNATKASRPYAHRIIILMTDGLWNQGRDPLLAAEDARRDGLVIHSVSLLPRKGDVTPQVSAITGGVNYPATNSAALEAAFAEIARTLPIVLTE
ncbi:MAG: hypothetical protein C0478_11770 [Planctomyces sp.]|nr:hypothetical protein [Planctomyces sp.]